MKSRTSTDQLDRISLFQGLPESEIEELIRGGVICASKHREHLFREGEPADHFWIVLLGAFKLSRQDAFRRESIVYFVGPGDPIAGAALLKSEPKYPVSCVAIGKATVLRIPRETYLRAWENHPEIQRRMNNILFQRMGEIQEQMALQRYPLRVRVAHLLIRLLERHSSGTESIVPFPITRREISDSVGSSVESVIRLLSEWSSQGILRIRARRIEVMRLERLVGVSRRE